MKVLVTVIAVVAAAVTYTGLGAQQQEMLPRPGPGSGITRVEGTVNIGNSPAVRALQDGDWRVTPVPVTFLKPQSAYLVTWPDGTKDRVTVVSEVGNGWIMIEGAPRRWINLGVARSIEEAR